MKGAQNTPWRNLINVRKLCFFMFTFCSLDTRTPAPRGPFTAVLLWAPNQKTELWPDQSCLL